MTLAVAVTLTLVSRPPADPVPVDAQANSSGKVESLAAEDLAIPGSLKKSPRPEHSACRVPDVLVGNSRVSWPKSVTILGEKKPLDPKRFELGQGPYEDPSRKLWWRSGSLLAWQAAALAEGGDWAQAIRITRTLLSAIERHPDPGSATPAALTDANSNGWDEGTVYRRSQALLCLTAAVPVTELEPALRAHAEVFFDPKRYPGPPERGVHNHGLMINLHLLELAEALQDDGYQTIALERLSSEWPQAFSKEGFANEAANHYQFENYSLWSRAQVQLERFGYESEATKLSAVLAKAVDVGAHFTAPSGLPILYGNTRESDVMLEPESDPGRSLKWLDAEAGMAAGRFSWQDTSTTHWTAMNRENRGAHGHEDALSVTWHAMGLPILVDVGQSDYSSSELTLWSKGPSAHNTISAQGQQEFGSQSSNLRLQSTAGIDTIKMERNTRDTSLQRTASFDDRQRSVTILDSSDRPITQYWHFHPDWRAQEPIGNTVRLIHRSGKQLTVTTSATASIESIRGSDEPMGGWYATGFDSVVAAPQLRIVGGSSLETTMVVSD